MSRAAIVRDSIEGVTRMLSQVNVPVTQRGDRAFVAYDAAGKPVRVNLPHLPDSVPEDVIKAVQGFLDHEVAHILFTDATVRASTKALHRMHNILEDCFIEKKMMERFVGSRSNLSSVRSLVFVEKGQKNFDAVTAIGGDELAYWQILCVTMFRAMAGHQECIDFLDDGDKWALIKRFHDKLKFCETEIALCKNTHDTLALAERVMKALAEKERPEEQPDAEEGGDEGEESKDGEEGDKSKKSKKSKKKDKDDKSEDDKADDKEKSEGEEQGEEEGEEQKDEATEGSGKEGQEGEDDDEGDDEPQDDDQQDGSGDDEGGDADGDEVEAEAEDPEWVKAAKLSIEEAEDFEDALADHITEEYKIAEELAHGEWLVFSEDQDIFEKYQPQPGFDTAEVGQMQERVGRMIGPMSKELERLILAKKRSIWETGHRRGRLNPASLHRLRTGDDRVFRRKIEHRMKNTAVSLLVDCSGSMMHGMRYMGDGSIGGVGRINIAVDSAFALASMLERCKIPVEVIGFTTKDEPDAYERERRESERRIGRKFSFNEVCYHPLMKGWNERLGTEVKARFAAIQHDRDLLNQNCDPLSVAFAARRLAQRPEERRILMVLSDGFPAFMGDVYAAQKQLKKTVKDIEKSGMEVLAIGIQSDSVKDFYPKSVVINDLEGLPKAIMSEMRTLLLKS